MTRYRYRSYGYRAPSRVSGRSVAAVAVAGVVLYGFTTAGHPHPGHAAPAAMATRPVVTAAIPAAISYTPASWSRAFLLDAGYQPTGCNLAFVRGWERAEGGNWQNAARYNPLDDELPRPGSHRINTTGPGQGVQAYISWGQGLAATRLTLSGPDYASIRAALTSGNDAQRAADAVAASPWGTGRFTVTCGGA
jgi:hypothetical protein